MYKIAIANQKGGVGKTTLAMHLGAALSRRHRILVVDVDPQQSTAWWADNPTARLPFDYAGAQNPRVLERLGMLRLEYDFMIVDTPGSVDNTRILEAVLDQADYVVVPMTPEPLSVDPTIRTIQRLIEPRHLRYTVVLNKIDPRVPAQGVTWQHLLDVTFGFPRTEACLRLYKAHTDTPVLGQLVTGMPDNRRTAGPIADITAVSAEIAGQITAPMARW